MAREQAASVAGATPSLPARDELPEPPAPPTVRRVALRLAGHVVLAAAVLVGVVVPAWRDDGLAFRPVFWTVLAVYQLYAAWVTSTELRALRAGQAGQSGTVPAQAGTVPILSGDSPHSERGQSPF